MGVGTEPDFKNAAAWYRKSAEQGNHAAAVESYRAALDILPGMPDALFSIGWTYALMDNREEAIRYLELYVAGAGANAPEHYVRAAQTKLTQLQL